MKEDLNLHITHISVDICSYIDNLFVATVNVWKKSTIKIRVYFPPFFARENFCDFLFAFLYNKSLVRRGFSKRKEFAPEQSKFFPFRVDPFSESRQRRF